MILFSHNTESIMFYNKTIISKIVGDPKNRKVKTIYRSE